MDFFIIGISIFMLLSLFLWAVVFHEIGHVLGFRLIARLRVPIIIDLPRVYVGFSPVEKNTAYLMINRREKIGVYVLGVLLGLLPILIASLLFWPLLILLFPYFVGCHKDIKNTIRMLQFPTVKKGSFAADVFDIDSPRKTHVPADIKKEWLKRCKEGDKETMEAFKNRIRKR